MQLYYYVVNGSLFWELLGFSILLKKIVIYSTGSAVLGEAIVVALAAEVEEASVAENSLILELV